MSKKTLEKQGTEKDPLDESTEKPPDQPWFIPNDEEQSVYRFIIAASRRARQLQTGARPVISTTSRKPTKISMEEIRRRRSGGGDHRRRRHRRNRRETDHLTELGKNRQFSPQTRGLSLYGQDVSQPRSRPPAVGRG